MEEIVKMGVQAVVIWDYQEDEAKQLKELGIAPVMVKMKPLKNCRAASGLWVSFSEKKTAPSSLSIYIGNIYNEIQSYQDQVSSAEKPKVLYHEKF